MDIRNILHKKKENKQKRIGLVVLSAIIIFGAILLISNIAKSNQKTTYKVWDQIHISGTIIADDNYPINTHKIFNNNKEFGIKSSSINLNNLNNQELLLNWTIDEIDTKYPILNIKNIQDPTSKLIITDNRYFFTQELISFDFSQDTDIKAKKIDNYIQIYYQEQPMITIETFICNKVTPTQNCEQLIYTYTSNLNEMFTTYLWYTFYKNKENSRVTFNNQTLGYIVKAEDNEFLLSISHLINIVDSKFLAENKKELIKQHCTDQSWAYLKDIKKIESQIVDNDLIKFDIDGTTDTKKKVNCKLTINIRNDWEVKNNILNYNK